MSEILPNLREYYRLVYPFSQMPKIVIEETEFDLKEISEKGLILECQQINAFRIGVWIAGVILFKNNQTAKVAGKIIRVNRNNIVVGQLQGLTFRNLIIEQQDIIRRFASLS